jgi:uncharacterized protein (DUF2267 family)
MRQGVVTAFEHTLQTTNTWLHDVMVRLGWQDRERSYHALRAVLHALRDRLSVDQAAALGAQLPLLIRGCYYEGWHPAGKPIKEHREAFLARVGKEFAGDPGVDPEDITRAIFQVLAEHVSAGEIEHVRDAVPADIRALWCEETRSLWV